MAITEETRHQMFQRLEEVLGHEEAVQMMEHLPPVGWAEVATKTDLAHLSENLEHRITIEMSALRVELADKLNRLLVQLIATMTAFITLVLVISRIG